MSIDFTNVKAMSDRIGNIVKVTDASGRVLWSAGPPMAAVEVTTRAGYDWPKAYVRINGEDIYLVPDDPDDFDVVVWDDKLAVGTQIVFTNASQAAGPVEINHKDGTKTTASIGKVGMPDSTFTYTVIGDTLLGVEGTKKEYEPGMYEYGTPDIWIWER